MTALWKRQAQRAEERRALNEYDREAALQRLRDARAKYPITEEEALAVLTDADPRGRVKLYGGRCGQEMTSIERHYEQHGGMPQSRLVGCFEWMHSVSYGPLDDDEVTR